MVRNIIKPSKDQGTLKQWTGRLHYAVAEHFRGVNSSCLRWMGQGRCVRGVLGAVAGPAPGCHQSTHPPRGTSDHRALAQAASGSGVPADWQWGQGQGTYTWRTPREKFAGHRHEQVRSCVCGDLKGGRLHPNGRSGKLRGGGGFKGTRSPRP